MTWRGFITTDGSCRSLSYDPVTATCEVVIKDYADGLLTITLTGVTFFQEHPEGVVPYELGEIHEVVRAGLSRLRFCDHDDEVLLEVLARGVAIRLS